MMAITPLSEQSISADRFAGEYGISGVPPDEIHAEITEKRGSPDRKPDQCFPIIYDDTGIRCGQRRNLWQPVRRLRLPPGRLSGRRPWE